jgi:putative hydrolase of HD superfamily
MTTFSRLDHQIQFILEIDRLKGILRQTLLTDGSRQENSAEHSWHLAMMAIALQEYALTPINLARVIEMVLVHDLVEIDAGDTFCYDQDGNQSKVEREQQAADRLFGLLPADQATQLRQTWEEFEAGESDDARFARALDCLQPLLHNCETNGHTWQLHGIHKGQVLERMEAVRTGIPELWPLVERLIEGAIAAGHLADHEAVGMPNGQV